MSSSTDLVTTPENSADATIEPVEAGRLALRFLVDANGKIAALGDTVTVRAGDGEPREEAIRPLRELFTGTGAAPDFTDGPTPEFQSFFVMIESIILQFCEADGRDATDVEMERIFAELRRRPDARDGRLRSYLRAMMSRFIAENPMSQGEYDAVMRRLTRSARTFSDGPTSTHYLRTLRETLGEA